MNIDDQPRRIVEQRRVELREFIEIEHHAGAPGFELRGTNIFQQPVTYIESPAGQLRIQFSIEQVEEDAIRRLDSLRLELHTLFEIDRHPRVIWRRPGTDSDDPRRLRG